MSPPWMIEDEGGPAGQRELLPSDLIEGDIGFVNWHQHRYHEPEGSGLFPRRAYLFRHQHEDYLEFHQHDADDLVAAVSAGRAELHVKLL